MSDDTRTLTGCDEIAAELRRLWLVQRRSRVAVSAWSVGRMIRVQGLPATRAGRAWIVNALDLEAWWLVRLSK